MKIEDFKLFNIDGLVKSHKSPFDKLRANGGLVETIDFSPFVLAHDRPFVVSLSNHTKDFLQIHQYPIVNYD